MRSCVGVGVVDGFGGGYFCSGSDRHWNGVYLILTRRKDCRSIGIDSDPAGRRTKIGVELVGVVDVLNDRPVYCQRHDQTHLKSIVLKKQIVDEARRWYVVLLVVVVVLVCSAATD